VNLNISVLEVAKPECLKTLVNGQHCFDTIHEAFQTSLQLWHLVCQSNVLHYLATQFTPFPKYSVHRFIKKQQNPVNTKRNAWHVSRPTANKI